MMRLLEYLKTLELQEDLSVLIEAEDALIRLELDHCVNDQDRRIRLSAASCNLDMMKKMLEHIYDSGAYRAFVAHYSIDMKDESGLLKDPFRINLKAHLDRLEDVLALSGGKAEAIRLILAQRVANMKKMEVLYKTLQQKALQPDSCKTT
nr:hypothetical protein [Schwartzia sp. (in: firmicutes)]